MKRDQIKGKAENFKGRAKEAVGALTGNKKTEANGALDRAKGALRQKIGEVKRDLSRKVEE
jgi:uncharacterized protein YjbJ (UPF0337 family)